MMNKKRLMAILAAGVLTATSFNPVMIKAESVSAEEAGMAVPADAAGMSVPADAAGAAVSADEAGAAVSEDEAGVAVSADEAGVVVAGDGSETAVFSEDGTPVKKTVKAADINMKVQDSYDFPFLGLKAVLPEELKKQIENSDMLMITEEEWNDDSTGFKYAFFHFDLMVKFINLKKIHNRTGTTCLWIHTTYVDFFNSCLNYGTCTHLARLSSYIQFAIIKAPVIKFLAGFLYCVKLCMR